MNGAVAFLGKKGDLLTIMNFGIFAKAEAKKWKPRVIVLGKGNKIVDTRGI
jgi:aspartate 1-decarboxylase